MALFVKFCLRLLIGNPISLHVLQNKNFVLLEHCIISSGMTGLLNTYPEYKSESLNSFCSSSQCVHITQLRTVFFPFYSPPALKLLFIIIPYETQESRIACFILISTSGTVIPARGTVPLVPQASLLQGFPQAITAQTCQCPPR